MRTVLNAVFHEQCFDVIFVFFGDLADDQILIGCQTKFDVVPRGHGAQTAEQLPPVEVADSAIFHEQAVIPGTNIVLLPAIRVAVRDKCVFFRLG